MCQLILLVVLLNFALNSLPSWAQDTAPPLAPDLHLQTPSKQDTSSSSTSTAAPLLLKSEVEEDHGQAPIGVLGCWLDYASGIIRAVYPGSDLTRWGVVPGDRIVMVNNHPYNGSTIIPESKGLPGSTIPLVIDRQGAARYIEPVRVDCHMFLGRADSYAEPARMNYQW